MTTTTSYGFWNNFGDEGSVSVEDTVALTLGAFANEYDADAIVAEYREQINEALPTGVSLSGNDFYGPYYRADQEFDGYPVDDNGVLEIAQIIEAVDLWAIVSRHEHNA